MCGISFYYPLPHRLPSRRCNSRARVSSNRITASLRSLDRRLVLSTFSVDMVRHEKSPEHICVQGLAEMEGFEPPHALRRLPDFESGPFSHLGTSPDMTSCATARVTLRKYLARTARTVCGCGQDRACYYDIFLRLLQEKYLHG